MSEPGILPRPIPFGKYYLLERINVGGMAEVFKAKAFGVEGFERLLAVKQILSSIAEDESFINMFIDEAKIAGALQHPNIAQIFDLGKVDGSYFIALEYISGKDLKTSFERARRIGEKVDIPRVCHIVMKVCEGLAHAHDKKDLQGRPLNIVHRDVSPQNVLISYEGEVKIIDFGIAKAQGKTSQTQSGTLKGKFSYMSPEQVRGLYVDHRSDLFSLGIVLYELLTHERLFLGDSDLETLARIRKVEMSPPSLYNPHIPKELEDIVLRALARTPEERFQSASDFAEALERFMRNQGYYYGTKDLAAYMKEAFSADIEFENKKLDYYRSLNLKPLTDEDAAAGQARSARAPAAVGAAGDLSWGEDEMETQIFDRNSEEIGESAILSAEDLPAVPTNTLESLGAAHADAPTIEYDRWDVDLDLAPITFKDEVEPDLSVRRPVQPTARITPVERRAAPQVTVPSPMVPTVATRPAQSGGSKGGVIVLAAVLVVALGLGLFFLDARRSSASIVFTTEPGDVQILINDQLVHAGPTPFEYKLRPGTARIVINGEGMVPFERELDIERGNTYKLSHTFKRALSESTGLAIKTEPEGARIELTGMETDEVTPLTIRKLAPGKLTLRVSKEGYFEESQEVEIEEEKITSVEIALRPKAVALTVNSNPDRSEFTVYELESGRRVASGRTPDVVRELDASLKYRVVVERRGYEEWEEVFEPSTALEATVAAELSRPRREEAPAVASSTSSSRASASSARTGSAQPTTTRTASNTAGASSASSAGSTPPARPAEDDNSGTGVISIASRPVARVYINDKDTGRYTPLIDFKIKAGKHKIGLVNPEFGLNKTYYVDLKAGESQRIINR